MNIQDPYACKNMVSGTPLARLGDELERREQEIERLNAYIDGMEAALRSMRRIVIQNGVRQ